MLSVIVGVCVCSQPMVSSAEGFYVLQNAVFLTYNDTTFLSPILFEAVRGILVIGHKKLIISSDSL